VSTYDSFNLPQLGLCKSGYYYIQNTLRCTTKWVSRAKQTAKTAVAIAEPAGQTNWTTYCNMYGVHQSDQTQPLSYLLLVYNTNIISRLHEFHEKD
jgi:hypothetical protein